MIVSTHEGAETLGCCPEACIEQNYDNFEIVVCDNWPSKESKEAVDRIDLPRTIDHRSPTPLTMSENWSLAYGISKGEYIIFIGDDDGLMPHAIFQLDQLINESVLSGMYWNHAAYAWPSLARSDIANYLIFGYIPNFHIYDGRTVIRDVLSGHASEHLLPNCYHGLTSRTIIEAIRTRQGKIAVGHGPDTYTSFGIAYRADRHTRVMLPMLISRCSAKSAAGSFIFPNAKQSDATTAWPEGEASESRLYASFHQMLAPWILIADSFRSDMEIAQLRNHHAHLQLEHERLLRDCIAVGEAYISILTPMGYPKLP